MEEERRLRSGDDVDNKEIIVSQSIKAGKRIYYLDVKKNRKGDWFLSITESKKIVTGDDITYEKHKIFLYNEDLDKFQEALTKAIAFIKASQQDNMEESARQGKATTQEPVTDGSLTDGIEPLDEKELKIDIDF